MRNVILEAIKNLCSYFHSVVSIETAFVKILRIHADSSFYKHMTGKDMKSPNHWGHLTKEKVKKRQWESCLTEGSGRETKRNKWGGCKKLSKRERFDSFKEADKKRECGHQDRIGPEAKKERKKERRTNKQTETARTVNIYRYNCVEK